MNSLLRKQERNQSSLKLFSTSQLSRSMRNLNFHLIVIFIRAYQDRRIFTHRISIQLERLLWNKIIVLIASQSIILASFISNSEKFKVAEMNMKNKNSRKKNLRRNHDEDEWIDYIVFFTKEDLFDKSSVLTNCLVRKFFSITIINIDVIEYAFVDELVAQKNM